MFKLANTLLLSNDIVEEGRQRDDQGVEQRSGRPGGARRRHRAPRDYPAPAPALRRQGKYCKRAQIISIKTHALSLSYQNVVYVYVPKQADLGRACGVSRNIVASTILRDPDGALHDKVQKLKDKIESIVE